LLLGGTGTGKTTSLRTVLDTSPKARLFGIFTEPGMEVVADLPKDRFFWQYIPPSTVDWVTMALTAQKIGSQDQAQLAKMIDPDRPKFNEFVKVLSGLASFIDQHGHNHGCVDKFGPEDFLALDSLSGLNVMVMNMVAGNKPVRSQADWGIAMKAIENFITRLTGLNCPVIVIGHVEREFDEATGNSLLMASTLGRKLAPLLPRFFSDVILTQRQGTKFSWSTAAINVDLKARNLPIADGLQPSFVPLIQSFKQRTNQ